MLRGLTTMSYFADDVAKAADWYAGVFGIEPYYRVDGGGGQLAYVEFRLGDRQDEFGIISRAYAPGTPADDYGSAPIAFWHVDDVEAALAALESAGARPHQPVVERAPGYVTASVVDPFGNVLGIMYNQHFVDTIAAQAT